MRGDLPDVQSKTFVPEGGLDLVTPLLLLKDGVAFDARNYECDNIAGYSRIAGYDTFISGKTPSEMDFRLAFVQVLTGTLKSGDLVRGATSDATMTIEASYAGDKRITSANGVTGFYISEMIGTFVAGEALTHINGTATMTLSAIPVGLVGTTDAALVAARAVAEQVVRDLMEIPGSGEFLRFNSPTYRLASGPVMGICMLNDVVYVAKPAASWLFADDNIAFITPESDPTISSNRSWKLALQTTIPRLNAKFEFRRSNFHTPAGAAVIWGVSGTSKAFMFDGSAITYVTTGMVDDTPDHLEIHVNRLFLAFGGSLQYSPINDPLGAWSVVTGANELSMGSPITGLRSLKGDSGVASLLISTREKLWILYGNSSDTFKLVPFSSNSGALEHTIQDMGQPIFQNMFGLTRLAETQKFGGFEASAISDKIKPFVDERRGLAAASMICRDKNQYRVFYGDKTAVYATFRDGRPLGMFAEFFPHKVSFAHTDVLADNTELMLIGTEDGQLFKMDVGTSFAGQVISHHIRFAFNHIGSPRVHKHFMRAIAEIQAEGYIKVDVGYDLDYGDQKRGVTPYASLESGNEGGRWDQGSWDVGYWDASTATPLTIDTPGTGTNISLRFRGADNVSAPFTLPAILLDYTIRKKRRS